MTQRHILDLSLLQTFVLLVEERSVTRVAQRLHRTQPAISLQLNRLEQIVGRPIFESGLRHPKLTVQGETLLTYARRLLDLHDEARAHLLSDAVSGRVVLGCPDLYAAFLLPRTLARFQAAYPAVEVTVRCTLSRQVAQAMEEGSIDVALATRMPDVHPRIPSITLLRREHLVWLGADGGTAHRRDPMPIAMLPEGNLYRDHALAALDRKGIAWRIACVSESIAGLQAMALADAAVIVLAKSVDVAGLRQLGRADGLPQMPVVDLMLWQRRPGRSSAADHLASHIARDLGERVGSGPNAPDAA
ncbi:LysR substrate-binding domain-containing protein [Methylobacterium sp. PvR107]|uniref:LysR substrate-binding domain-containing protein n=1 Tax=Methylobacterium sp. PvR107 TaxID=2806597 RepID=UPI001AEAA0E6|nr:LysR substrate-binding domain-containing protein [Methylobacterium sp. PvR107]